MLARCLFSTERACGSLHNCNLQPVTYIVYYDMKVDTTYRNTKYYICSRVQVIVAMGAEVLNGTKWSKNHLNSLVTTCLENPTHSYIWQILVESLCVKHLVRGCREHGPVSSSWWGDMATETLWFSRRNGNSSSVGQRQKFSIIPQMTWRGVYTK